MNDYHDLYLKWYVLLLADVFEEFRNNSLKNYGLCPSHFLSVPFLIWDIMFNITKVELEVSLDVYLYLFFEKGMRNRVSYFSQTGNKYLKSYDLKQESKHIIYLDANKL